MSDKLYELNKLVDLAQETAPAAREKLLRDVTDLFMSEPDALTEQEIENFGFILVQLIRDMEIGLRRHLAETVAAERAAPRQLVAELAGDTIEVARPVLSESPVLDDADLLAIIRKHSQAHLLAISQRPAVSDPVAGSLAERGDDGVLSSLAGNPGAALSETTMGTMLTRSADQKAIGTVLIGRADLSAETAQRVFNNISGSVLQQILIENPALKREKFDALAGAARVWFENALSDSDRLAAEKDIARKAEQGSLDNVSLAEFVRNGDVWRFVAGLSRMTEVEFDVVRKSMFDPSGQKLAVLCMAVDMDSTVFESVVEFTNLQQKRSHRDKEALMGVYAAMTPEPAKRALRFLRDRREPEERSAGQAARRA